VIEMRLDRRFGVWAESGVECGGHEISLARLMLSITAPHDRNVKANRVWEARFADSARGGHCQSVKSAQLCDSRNWEHASIAGAGVRKQE
jgi:hypothetical protein